MVTDVGFEPYIKRLRASYPEPLDESAVFCCLILTASLVGKVELEPTAYQSHGFTVRCLHQLGALTHGVIGGNRTLIFRATIWRPAVGRRPTGDGCVSWTLHLEIESLLSWPLDEPAVSSLKLLWRLLFYTKKKSGKKGTAKKEPAEIVAEKIVETVAAIAGVETEEKPAAKKTAAKKSATKKSAAAKASTKKTTAKAEDSTIKSVLPIEYQCKGGKYTGEEIVEKCKADYKAGGRKQVRSIQVYVKGSKAYYVVNGKSEDKNGKAYSVDL